MNVCDTLSYGDTLMCQIWYGRLIDKKAAAQTQTHIKNPINLTLRLKVNIISGSYNLE